MSIYRGSDAAIGMDSYGNCWRLFVKYLNKKIYNFIIFYNCILKQIFYWGMLTDDEKVNMKPVCVYVATTTRNTCFV